MDRKYFGWKTEFAFLSIVGVVAIGILIAPFGDKSVTWGRSLEIISLWFQCYGAILVSFEYLRLPLIESLTIEVSERSEEMSRMFHEDILKEKDILKKQKQLRDHGVAVIQNNHIYKFITGHTITARAITGLGLALIILGYAIQICTK